MLRFCLLLLALASLLHAEKPLKLWVEEFNRIDELVPGTLGGHIPNDGALAFLNNNIPRFDCPDQQLVRTYYFRWWTYRKHIRKTAEGYVITEFLPEVPWARKYNTINCPAGHQFREGRWLHDSSIIEDYARFYFGKNAQGKPRQYSFWAADSVLQYCMVTGKNTLAIELLDALVANYREWEKTNGTEDGLFWQVDDRDGMEVSVGGTGKRPTINSYLYADAMAIALIAGMAERWDVRREFASKAIKLGRLINEQLWDAEAQFYKTIPHKPEGSRHKLGKTSHNGPWVDVRELHGYTPWYFNIPEQRKGREVAWKQLTDPRGFAAPYGPTTAEQRHPGFAISRQGHECQWNGPSWPFATSITLTAMANVLHHYPQEVITKQDYFKQLQIYSNSHRLTLLEQPEGPVAEHSKGKDTTAFHICWIDENLDPHTGQWLARALLKEKAKATKDLGKLIPERGQHYNHSTFCDLIITGLCGLNPRPDSRLVVHPLVPEEEWDWFKLENVKYHDQLLTIQWDKDGSKYGKGKGLRVIADGKVLGSSPKLGELVVKLD